MILESFWIPLRFAVIVLLLSEMIPAFLGAIRCWQLRTSGPLIRYMGLALVMIAFEICTSFIGASADRGLIPPQVRHNSWYIAWFVVGRLGRAVTLWVLAGYLLVLRRGK